jgi:hypothetical protein
MMAHHPVPLTEAPERKTTATSPAPAPPAASRLDATHQRLFAQRLAVLIARIRAANQKEVVADEQ